MMNKREKFLYVVAGTGVGTILGILFAPRAGSDLRQTLTSQAQRGVDLITEKVDEGKRYLSEQGGAGGTVRNIVERGKQQFNESVEGVKNRFNESVEAGRQEYESQRRDPRERGAL
jgi:gas vesicle protein